MISSFVMEHRDGNLVQIHQSPNLTFKKYAYVRKTKENSNTINAESTSSTTPPPSPSLYERVKRKSILYFKLQR